MTAATEGRTLQVQVNTGTRIHGGEDQDETIESLVRQRLARFAERLTRIEVHLRDVDGDRKGPEGFTVRIEARPAGGQPVATSDKARTARVAVTGAIDKLIGLLDTHFGKHDAVR